MNVLFVVTGFGFGDTIRVNVILRELEKRIKDLSVMFMGYENSYNFFHKKYLTLKIKGYSFPDYNLEFKTNRFLIKNFYLPVTWLANYMKYKKAIQKFDPDIIISDFEPIANLIAKRLRKKCISIFGYDPKLFEKYPEKSKKLLLQAKYIDELYKRSDLVIIPTFKPKEKHDNVMYVNLIVDKNPEDLVAKHELMQKLKLKKEPILVMLGGSNYGVNLAKRILKLSDAFNEDFIFFGGKSKIQGLHFKFAKNFSEYLKVSKAVITLAGKLTLSECLVFKKPMLIFPIKNHIEQLLNAYSLRNIAHIGSSKNLEDSIRKFLDDLGNINEKLKLFDVKADGAKESVDIILEEAKGII